MFETNLVSNNSSLEDSILGSRDVHVDLEIEFIGLGFCTWKSSLMDSVSAHEIESNGIDFRSWKSSPKHSAFFVQHMHMKSPRKRTCE